jgi:hypothetical protein
MKQGQRDISDCDGSITRFLETIRGANSLVGRWQKSIHVELPGVGVSWREVESQKRLVEEALQEIGWQALKLYEAGVFKEDEEVCEDDSSQCMNEEEDDSSQSINDEEEIVFIETSAEEQVILEHLKTESEPCIEESTSEESTPFSEDDLDVFRSNIFEHESPIPYTDPERFEPIAVWEEKGILLKDTSTKVEREDSFRAFSSAIAKGYFVHWKELFPKTYPDIVRFYLATMNYIKSFPRVQRPESGLGDKAYEHLSNQIPNNARIRKIIKKYNEMEETSISWLEKAEMFWKRVTLSLNQQKVKPKRKIGFNPEIALNVLEGLCSEEKGEKQIREYLLKMVEHGMSNDPRLIRILHKEALRIDLQTEPKFSTLRRALRTEEEGSPSSEEYELEWEHAAYFLNKKVIVIGGEKKRILLSHLSKIIPKASVEWIPTSSAGSPNRVQALTQSIERGKIDYVLVIQDFVSHSVSMPIFKASKSETTKTKAELIIGGYGKNSICEALERCIAQREKS